MKRRKIKKDVEYDLKEVIIILRAKSHAGDYITLATLPKEEIEYLRKKERFYCPECKGGVIVRAGPKVIPHFAHVTTTNCSLHGGEGVYHQRGKLLLYRWLLEQNINTKLEFYIPEIKQRPDLFIQIGHRKIAMEYQCATISISEVNKRNAGYKRAGITPIWILGANLFKRTSHTHLHMNAFTRQFVHHFSSKLPTMIFYFCPLTVTFSVINDMHVTSMNRAIAKFTFPKLHELTFIHLFSHERLSTYTLFSLWQKEKRNFRLLRGRAYGKELTWRYWLYEKGLHREILPSVVYLPVKGQQKMNVPLWNWQSRFIIDYFHPLPIGKKFTHSDVLHHLKPFILSNSPPLFNDPIKEYLTLLEQISIVKRTAKSYMKIKEIHFYKHIEQAIAGDDELLHLFMYNQKQE